MSEAEETPTAGERIALDYCEQLGGWRGLAGRIDAAIAEATEELRAELAWLRERQGGDGVTGTTGD